MHIHIHYVQEQKNTKIQKYCKNMKTQRQQCIVIFSIFYTFVLTFPILSKYFYW